MSKAALLWATQESLWEAELQGKPNAALGINFREIAKSRGLAFIPIEKVASLPTSAFLERVEAIPETNGEPDINIARSLLGTAKGTGLILSKLLETYWELEKQSATRGMSEDQIRRWANPIKKAFRNLIDQLGDKDVGKLSRDDALDFRRYWEDRIDDEGLTANSANKDITHIAKVIRRVNNLKRLGLDLSILADLRFKEDDKHQRPSFSVDWIKTKLMAPGALAGLDTEARCVVLTMINTGARPSEIVGLLPHHIHLDASVPYISIEPEGRRLKNQPSKRTIPLVGVSFAAMKGCVQGFPTYAFKDKISDEVNHYLSANKLRETPEHSLYSLRHSFEDRMIDADVDERIRRDLFGHSLRGERYGKGSTLDKMLAAVQKVAL